MKYIVEHMEEDLHEWCRLEYAHMLQHVGEGNLIFTNMQPNIVESFETDPELAPLKGSVPTTKDVTELGIPIERICLMDMRAEKDLVPEDADKFDYVLFGGILGDGLDPDADRTSILRKLGFPARRLGPGHFTTDSAVGTAHMVLEKKMPLETIEFCDEPTIKFSKFESVELPYRYIGKRDPKTGAVGPLLPPGMYDLLKRDNEADVFGLNMN
ncbi:hypothetical protein H9P43_006329 [Blastocladiella emersonii ATCC 22665]|nr:hypothetical protein H9P43_006329 [Blastocladiella emersonii ATCC 22665]